MLLVPTNKLFKSPSGLIFECCGIVRVVSITIDKIKVFIDFHIFAILEFELLIGHPLNNLFQEKSSHGSLNEEFRKTTSATHSNIPMAKHYPNHDPFEEVKFVTPFVSPSPLLEHKPCPSGHPNVVLNNGQDTTLTIHDVSYEKENICAMDTLLSTTCFYEDPNHLLILVFKLSKRMVVDIFVYHKYCKSRSCTMILTLQIERKCSMLCGEAGNYTTNDSYKMKFPWSRLRL